MIVLAWSVTQFFICTAFCELLDIKYKRWFIISFFVAGMTLIKIVWAYLFIYVPSVPSHHIVLAVLAPLFAYLFIKFTCRDKTSRVIFAIALIYSISLSSHILKSLVYHLITSEITIFDFTRTPSMYGSLIGAGISILSLIAFIMVWKRSIGSIYPEIPNIWAFIFILGGQLTFSMSQYLIILTHGIAFDIWAVVGVIIMLIGNLAILQILLTNSKKKETEEQLTELQHMRELEQLHYSGIETRRQELIKIRHDFNNQLTTIHQLFATDKKGHAEKLLNEMEQSIADTSEYIFCQNAIVNAVLTEKQKECIAANITLEAEITLYENCGITPTHLCSIFTNLLDNAIRACKSLAKDQRKIELRTAVKGDYLYIKCVNPLPTNPEKARKRKGYGKLILSDIARHYSGNFTAEKIDDIHVAMISLLLS